MPEHSIITDPNIHEPKGVASASSGEVYVADGLGSGAWSSVFNLPHACIRTEESDAETIASIGTTPQTFPFFTAGPNKVLSQDLASNSITTVTAGDFFVSFRVTFSTQASGDAGLYEFKILADGVETGLALARQMSGSSDTGTAAILSLLAIDAGAEITVSVESDNASDADDIAVYTGDLVLVQLSEA